MDSKCEPHDWAERLSDFLGPDPIRQKVAMEAYTGVVFNTLREARAYDDPAAMRDDIIASALFQLWRFGPTIVDPNASAA